MPRGGKRLNRTHCMDCSIELDNSNIVIYNGYNKGRCRKCYNEKCREGYDFIKDRTRNLKRKFSMSLDDYSKLFNSQLGVCKVCLKPSDKTLHVDHNHLTGEIRGLLCQRCNHTIGLLEEDPDLVMKMYEYLRDTTWEVGMDKLHLIGKKDVS